jgi:DNA-binding NarL/FixJ family response regulator
MLKESTSPQAPPKIRLLVVDAHTLDRLGVLDLLAESDGVEVAGACADGRSVFALADRTDADLVLIDPDLPDVDGYVVIRALLACLPRLTVVVMTELSSCQVFEALQAGAQGVLLKSQLDEELLDALSTVVAGGWYLSGLRPAQLRLVAALEAADDAPESAPSEKPPRWVH